MGGFGIRLAKPDKDTGIAMIDPSDYVSVTDIADRLGFKRSSVVSNWIARFPDFPEPEFVVARGQVGVYSWKRVRAWLWAHNKITNAPKAYAIFSDSKPTNPTKKGNPTNEN